MTQVSRTEKKMREIVTDPNGCPGCKHLRSFTDGQAYCSLYMDYPTTEDLKVGCIYRLGITEKYYRKKK